MAKMGGKMAVVKDSLRLLGRDSATAASLTGGAAAAVFPSSRADAVTRYAHHQCDKTSIAAITAGAILGGAFP